MSYGTIIYALLAILGWKLVENDEKRSVIQDLVESNPNAGRGNTCKFIITDKVIEQVEHLAGLGLNIEEIAEMLQISPATLARRKKDNASFEMAIRRGRLKAQVTVSNALYEKATDNKDTSAMIFYLKNRSPEKWSDKRKIDHTSSDGSVTMPTNIIIEAKEITNDNTNVKITPDAED